MNLNRIFIVIKPVDNCVLNYNYQYELLKVIHNAYSLESEMKAKIFHDEGFLIDNKKFKLLNSCLMFETSEFSPDGIIIKTEDTVKLMVSGAEDVINYIVKGLVKMESFAVLGCKFSVEGILPDKNVKFKRTMLSKVLTMVVESKYNSGKIEYLNIYDNRLYEALAQNLRRKYQLIYNEEFKDELYFDIENILTAKKKNINGIRGNGYKVGYGNFNIYIQTSIKMQKVAYYCGIGQNNTLGCGTLIHLTSR